MIKCYTDNENWHIKLQRTGFNEVDCEVENVIVFGHLEVLTEDVCRCCLELGILSGLDLAEGVVLFEVEQYLTNEKATYKNCWEIVREISRIVLLCPDPVLDVVCRLVISGEIIEGLDKFLVWLLFDFLVITLIFLHNVVLVGWLDDICDSALIFGNELFEIVRLCTG